VRVRASGVIGFVVTVRFSTFAAFLSVTSDHRICGSFIPSFVIPNRYLRMITLLP
jgi:hypothetical protein